MNLYGFGGGDPVNFSDPMGLSACPKDVGGDGKTQSVDDCSQEVQDKWAATHIKYTSREGNNGWAQVDPALRSAVVRTSMAYRMSFGISAGAEGGHSEGGRHDQGGAVDINQANGINFRFMTGAAAAVVGNAIAAGISNRVPTGRMLWAFAPGMAFKLDTPMDLAATLRGMAAHFNHVHISVTAP